MAPSCVIELACVGTEPTHAVDSTSQWEGAGSRDGQALAMNLRLA
jgi:hypothetical protein